MGYKECNKMEKIVLIGAGGYCSGVIDSIEKDKKYRIVGITDPISKDEFCGYPVLGTDDVLQEVFNSGVKKAHITVGSVKTPNLRKKLVEMAKNIGFELVTIIDSSSVIASRVKLGEMVYVAKGAIVNSDVEIGNYCMINTGCIIEHGCRIKDWVHVAPGSVIAGDVIIGDSSHIGLNSSILQGIVIGHDVIVGAGSTVIRNVDSNKTVYGVVKG